MDSDEKTIILGDLFKHCRNGTLFVCTGIIKRINVSGELDSLEAIMEIRPHYRKHGTPDHGSQIKGALNDGSAFVGTYNAMAFGNTGSVECQGRVVSWDLVLGWEIVNA